MKPNGRSASAVWPAAVALLAVVVYANTLGNGFALDDVPLVRDNPEIASPAAIPGLFVRPYWPDAEGAAAGLYRPLTVASFALNRAVSGPGPAGFHAVNVLLHAAVSALAWFALRRAGTRYGTALLGASLFAVHPIHVEAVAGIAGRAELLAAAGVLGAWIAHRRWCERGGRAWPAAAGVLYLGAVLSKEGAVLAPAVFLIDDAVRARHGEASRPVRWARPVATYGAVLAVAAILRAVALGGLRGAEDAIFLDNPAAFSGTAARVATALWVQARYAALMLWPASLSSDYSFDAIPAVASAADPRGVAGLALVTAGAALAVHGWRRSRTAVLGVGLWVAFFLPSSNVLFPAGTIMAERLAYLPSLGACLLAGHAGATLAARPGPRRRRRSGTVIAAAVVAVAALGARTWVRNPVWKDNATLALHDVRVEPRSAKLHAGAGIVRAERGETAEAERHLREALRLYPDYAQMHYNLGVLLAARDRYDEALRHVLRAATLAPGNPLPYKVAAGWLERAGRTDEALEAYARGAALDPGDLGFRFNRGRALLAAGRPREAEEVLGALAADAPDAFPGRIALALLAEIRGDVAEARARYRDLLRDPGLPADLRPRLERALAALGPADGDND